MEQETVIVKYNAGNIRSVLYALERIGAEATVTDEHALIRSARRVIFPGVGEASSAMKYLRERGLDQVLVSLTQPVLGICLGMQLMCRYSAENDTPCLGIFDEDVSRFPAERGMKIPQIGWNQVKQTTSVLFKHIPDGSYFYFVHSYYAARGEHTIGTTDYVLDYSAALHRDNFYGVQFHPEKSATVGEQLLKNFMQL
jgi:glutamine amidotransferase